MPRRIIDGEGVWQSDKLAKVEPPEYRVEYTWLLPLALDNGTFEYSARNIYARCYAACRPDMTLKDVETILAEFERCGLLFRYVSEGGKAWAFWTGIDRAGRLPAPSQRHKIGPEP